ncbi:S-adenosyl-L-methionine-dependent methyltransferase [Apiospora marii]|uniref:S-adenosyl-L-methionine-dependent methyltransferase n=1 Tax=Apiospora marii TaxID=335849 RepID=UPI00312F1BB1
MPDSPPADCDPLKEEDRSDHVSSEPADSSQGDTDPERHTPSDTVPVISGFMPDEFLPEDLPEVDPRYLDPNLVSATQLPQSQTGIPQMQWVPAEVYREPSNSSVFEPDSVVGESGSKTGWTCSTKPSKRCLVTNCAWRRSKSPDACSISAPVRAYGPSTSGRPAPCGDCPQTREHPNSHVIGTDLSKIQPEHVLPNVEFIRGDCEDQWVFPHKFDYIHGRMLFSCFDDPRGVMEQAFRFLNPGGWIEYIDAQSEVASMDGTAEGTTIRRWGELLGQGLSRRGRDPLVVSHYKDWLHDIGFVDIVERKIPAPHGGWPNNPRLKLAGRFLERDTYDGARGISFGILRAAGMDATEIDELVDQVRVDLLDPHIHTYVSIRCVYGRKPFEWETAGGYCVVR